MYSVYTRILADISILQQFYSLISVSAHPQNSSFGFDKKFQPKVAVFDNLGMRMRRHQCICCILLQ